MAAEARSRFDRGDYQGAQSLIEQARANVPATSSAADSLRLQAAEVLIFQQRPSEALQLAQAPLRPESGGLAARREMLIGGAQRSTNPLEASERLSRALTAARASQDRATEGMSCLLLGQIQLETNSNARDALEWYRQAESAAVAATDARLRSLARFNVGRALIELREFDLAVAVFRQLLPVTELRAIALENLAIAYMGVGDYERALPLVEEAGDLIERQGRRQAQVVSRGTRGMLLWALGRRQEAMEWLQRSAALARELGEPPELRRRLDFLIPPLLELGRVDEAEKLSQETFALYQNHQGLASKFRAHSLVNRGRIHEERSRQLAAQADFRTALQEASPADIEIRQDAEFGLARIAAHANQREQAQRHFQAAIRLAESEQATLRSEDSKLTYLETVIALYRAYAAALLAWGDDGGALAVEESSRARLMANRVSARAATAASAVDLARLQKTAARSRAVFLAYWIDERNSHVRIVGGVGGRPERIPLTVSPPRLTELVREHNDLIERQLGDPRRQGKAAAELYQMLVEPLAARLPAGARVVIVPDGALHRLNFETLVRERGGEKGYWLEDVTVQVAPSLSLIEPGAAASTRAAGGRKLLLMGDALAVPDFDRLAHAREEMNEIRQTFGAAGLPVTERSGAEAVPSAFLTAAPSGYSHIHFSTHAQANRESPLDSAVILSPEPEGEARGRYRLRARDVARVTLAADLVTVSACRSAGDRAIQGEGMVGFAWAFLRAGAGNVIAGLWDVNDRSTVRLMKSLYERLTPGTNAAEALRAAKLEMIRQGKNDSKPYYWAPFQIYTRNLPRR